MSERMAREWAERIVTEMLLRCDDVALSGENKVPEMESLIAECLETPARVVEAAQAYIAADDVFLGTGKDEDSETLGDANLELRSALAALQAATKGAAQCVMENPSNEQPDVSGAKRTVNEFEKFWMTVPGDDEAFEKAQLAWNAAMALAADTAWLAKTNWEAREMIFSLQSTAAPGRDGAAGG